MNNKKKIVIYTVIMGDYDYLKDPEYIMANCDYVCFTNNPDLKSDIWEIRYDSNTELDNTRWQRRHKVLAHEYLLDDYEWCIYVDGNVRIIGDFRKYIEQESKGAPILCLKHPSRTCVYAEAEECINLKKDSPEIIKRQMEQYKEEGYPDDNGLVVTNILVRKHKDANVIRLMKLWWEEIEKNSRRDQLSFNYASWKLGIKFDISELKCWRSPYWMNPGIHTKDIKKVEEELIDHIQFSAYKEYQLEEKERYIALKERELKDADTLLGWKEQELKDANTLLGWKEQELKDANTLLGWKEQELRDANTLIACKEQELKKSNTLLEEKQLELDRVLNSTSWKLTGIFRSIKALLGKFRNRKER